VRQDIGRLMRERGLAGMVVFAYDRYSPALYYAPGRESTSASMCARPTTARISPTRWARPGGAGGCGTAS
jgi:hypothetical protein